MERGREDKMKRKRNKTGKNRRNEANKQTFSFGVFQANIASVYP